MLKSVVKIYFPFLLMETSSRERNEAFSATQCFVGVRSPDFKSVENICVC